MREKKRKKKLSSPQFCTVVAKLCIHTKLENIAKLFFPFFNSRVLLQQRRRRLPRWFGKSTFTKNHQSRRNHSCCIWRKSPTSLSCRAIRYVRYIDKIQSVLLQKRGIFSVIAWLSSNWKYSFWVGKPDRRGVCKLIGSFVTGYCIIIFWPQHRKWREFSADHNRKWHYSV